MVIETHLKYDILYVIVQNPFATFKLNFALARCGYHMRESAWMVND